MRTTILLGIFALLTLLANFQAHAGVFFLSADLQGENVVPPAATSASGFANFTLTDGPSPTLDYFIQLNGVDLDGLQTPDPGDDVTGIHLHLGAPGETGPLIYGMIGPQHDLDDAVFDPVAGTVSGTWDDADIFGVLPLSTYVEDLLNGQTYLQVHTVDFQSPAAELRGQLVTVPEARSSTMWTALGALCAAMVFFTRRRV